jgi:hypothetical protein
VTVALPPEGATEGVAEGVVDVAEVEVEEEEEGRSQSPSMLSPKRQIPRRRFLGAGICWTAGSAARAARLPREGMAAAWASPATKARRWSWKRRRMADVLATVVQGAWQ